MLPQLNLNGRLMEQCSSQNKKWDTVRWRIFNKNVWGYQWGYIVKIYNYLYIIINVLEVWFDAARLHHIERFLIVVNSTG